MKLKHHHQLRGPRYRQARREARRNGPLANWEKELLYIGMEPPKPAGVAGTSKIGISTALPPHDYWPIKETVLPGPACPVCRVTSGKCVTKSGKPAKQNHAGRDIL